MICLFPIFYTDLTRAIKKDNPLTESHLIHTEQTITSRAKCREFKQKIMGDRPGQPAEAANLTSASPKKNSSTKAA